MCVYMYILIFHEYNLAHTIWRIYINFLQTTRLPQETDMFWRDTLGFPAATDMFSHCVHENAMA